MSETLTLPTPVPDRPKQGWAFHLGNQRDEALRAASAGKAEENYHYFKNYCLIPFLGEGVNVNVAQFRYKWHPKENRLTWNNGTGEVECEDSWQKAAEDSSLPEWLRKRNQKDLKFTKHLKKLLQEGTSTIGDVSPPETDLPDSALKAFGYKRHKGYARLYTREPGQEKDQEIIKAHAVSAFFDKQGFEDLFKSLSGEAKDFQDILGYAYKIRPGTSPEDIIRKIQGVHAGMTQARQRLIKIEDEEVGIQQVSGAVNKLENWVKGIYLMFLDTSISDSQIKEQFNGLAHAFKALTKGQGAEKVVRFVKTLDPGRLLSQEVRSSAVLAEFTARAMAAAGSDCGIGFGGESSVIALKPAVTIIQSRGLMTHKAMNAGTTKGTSPQTEHWEYHKGQCRICLQNGDKTQDKEVGPCNICKEHEKLFD